MAIRSLRNGPGALAYGILFATGTLLGLYKGHYLFAAVFAVGGVAIHFIHPKRSP